jgi:hypothetical protein
LPLTSAFHGEISITGAEFVPFEAAFESTFWVWFEGRQEDRTLYWSELSPGTSEQGSLPEGLRLRLSGSGLEGGITTLALLTGYEITGFGYCNVELSTDGGDSWGYGIAGVPMILVPEPASIPLVIIAVLFLRRKRSLAS